MVTKTANQIIRPFTFDDAKPVVDLLNDYSENIHGWRDSDLDNLMNDWTSPGINVKETIRVVENEHCEIIGYVDVWDNLNPHVIKYVWAILHPDAWNEALYHKMLSWAEGCARERTKLAPEDTRVIMMQGTSSKDKRRKSALESFGFDLVRHFYKMEIDLDEKPAKSMLPGQLSIEPLNLETEIEDAILAADESFKDHWGYVEKPVEELLAVWKHHLDNDKDYDPSLWFLAKEGQQIAGICMCSNRTTRDPDMGWVTKLGVLKPWRRQGLGMALLLTAFNELHRRGRKRVGLEVDAASLTSATKLYEKAGMQIVRQDDTYEKELRPGKDLVVS